MPYHVGCDILCFFFFFFQAEDGIRDIGVTGVQTCTLPISAPEKLLSELLQLGSFKGSTPALIELKLLEMSVVDRKSVV